MGYKVFTRECLRCGWKGDTLLNEAMEFFACPSCTSPTVWRPGKATLIFFKEGWYEHVADDPKYITSMQQLRDECAANGLRSEYAEDSSVHRSTTHREI